MRKNYDIGSVYELKFYDHSSYGGESIHERPLLCYAIGRVVASDESSLHLLTWETPSAAHNNEYYLILKSAIVDSMKFKNAQTVGKGGKKDALK